MILANNDHVLDFLQIDQTRRGLTLNAFCIQKDVADTPFPNMPHYPLDWRGVYKSLQVPLAKNQSWTTAFRVADKTGSTTTQLVKLVAISPYDLVESVQERVEMCHGVRV